MSKLDPQKPQWKSTTQLTYYNQSAAVFPSIHSSSCIIWRGVRRTVLRSVNLSQPSGQLHQRRVRDRVRDRGQIERKTVGWWTSPPTPASSFRTSHHVNFALFQFRNSHFRLWPKLSSPHLVWCRYREAHDNVSELNYAKNLASNAIYTCWSNIHSHPEILQSYFNIL